MRLPSMRQIAPMRRLRIYSMVSMLGTLSFCAPAASEHPASEAQRKWWAFQALTDPLPPKVAKRQVGAHGY